VIDYNDDDPYGGYTPPPAPPQLGDPNFRLGVWTNDYDPGPNWNGGIPSTPGAPWNMNTNDWGLPVRERPSIDNVPRPPQTGGGGGGWGYLTEPFTGHAPAWNPWSPTAAPEIVRPPDFSYKEFQAPTKDSIYSDPSYEFRKGEGEKSLSNHIAATGAYRTGGTLKDFINYNQNAASQEYGNIFDRAVTAHNLGLQQALGTYGTNWGVSRDVLDRNLDVWKATNTWGQRENENVNTRNMDAFLADFDIFNSNRNRAGNYLTQAANMGA